MSKRTLNVFVFMIISLLLTGTFLTGCSTAKTQTVKSTESTPSPGSTTPSPSGSSGTTTAHSVKLTLYFPAPDAMGLVPIERTVEVTDQEVIKAMFKELESPPSGLEKPLPEGTKLLSASVQDGVATINMSKEFRKNFGGGSAGEQMVIYSIVNTLTTLSNVHSVQFLLEGQKQDGILGNLATDTPVKRNESLIRKTN